MTARRRPVAAALAALVASTVTASLLVAPAEAATITPKIYQRQAFRATNHQRVEYDLGKLRHQDCVQRFAVRQAKRMARQDRMFHQDILRVAQRCGLALAGENVAYGYPDGRAVVKQGWMKSPPHRANILNPGYRLLGMGARRSDDGTWYAAQVFGTKLG